MLLGSSRKGEALRDNPKNGRVFARRARVRDLHADALWASHGMRDEPKEHLSLRLISLSDTEEQIPRGEGSGAKREGYTVKVLPGLRWSFTYQLLP